MRNDITKCSGQGCPIKEKCYRFTVEAEPLYQSVFAEIPSKWKPDIMLKEVWECDMYWGEKNNDILKQLKEIMK